VQRDVHEGSVEIYGTQKGAVIEHAGDRSDIWQVERWRREVAVRLFQIEDWAFFRLEPKLVVFGDTKHCADMTGCPGSFFDGPNLI
jgi:hypothetical protein